MLPQCTERGTVMDIQFDITQSVGFDIKLGGYEKTDDSQSVVGTTMIVIDTLIESVVGNAGREDE